MALKDHILKLADGVSKCQENAKSLAQVIFRGLDDIADNLPEHPGGGSDVSVTQVLSSGTKTATITVDDTPTDLYAPDPTDVVVTQEQTSGTKIATITVDDTPTDLYAPTPTAPTDVDVTQVVSTGTKIATITVDDVPTDIYAPTGSAINYSQSEQNTGIKWIDGKDIYQKSVVITSLPSTAGSSVTYAHDISNVESIIGIESIIEWPDGTRATLDRVGIANNMIDYMSCITMTANATSIFITTGTDRHTLSAVVTLKYTKTS